MFQILKNGGILMIPIIACGLLVVFIVAERLKYFYDVTGVQPYIVLKDYDYSLQTNEEKLAYAEEYYSEHFTNEGIFLYMSRA